MANIDERVVGMSFENQKFSAAIADTIKALTKLDETIKKVGTTTGLGDIQKAADKINLAGVDKSLKGIQGDLAFNTKGVSDIQGAADKVNLTGLSGALENIKSKFPDIGGVAGKALDSIKSHFNFGKTAADDFAQVDRAANKVTLKGATDAIDGVNKKLNFPYASQAFGEIEKAGDKVELTPLTRAIDGVSSHISALQVAAITAFATISQKAIAAGGNFLKSFTIDPLKDGLSEYETNINSIQTILSNTKGQKFSGLDAVNKSLNQLNHYADKTIYNFTEMTRNIGTFTAAGVDLKTAVGSIKGIANLAALSGSNAQQASTVMYQLSQAISSGKVGLQDWNSVVNAGIGGKLFQENLAKTAQAMGTLKDTAVTTEGPMQSLKINGSSFHDSIQALPGSGPSWLTSDVLTTTLKNLSGDLTLAQIKAEGFTDAQAKAIKSQAKDALDAATKVKTFSALIDTAREAAGSGWSKTWQLVFGDFGEAKHTFTQASNALNGFINTSSKSRNSVLKDWKELGGRTVLIKGIKNVFDDLGLVIKPIHDAFRDVFPAKTGQDLFDLTKKFENFTELLKIGLIVEGPKIKSIFEGVFSALDIGKQVVGEVFRVLGDLFGEVGKGSGGFLDFAAGIGDAIANFDQMLKRGSGLDDFFNKIEAVLKKPIGLIHKLGDALGGLFGGEDTTGLSTSVGGIQSQLSPLGKLLDHLSGAFKDFFHNVGEGKGAIGQLFGNIKDTVGNFIDSIGDAFKNADYDKLFTIVQTSLIGGIFVAIHKALSNGAGKVNINFGSAGVLKNLTGIFDGLNSSLKSLQTGIKTTILLEIATAIGILAAGLITIASIDPKRLTSSMTAVAVGIGELIGAVALLGKVGVGGFITLPVIAAGMIGLAGAVDVLALAVKIFSTFSWEGLAKGLTGVGGVLGAVGFGLRGINAAQIGAIGLGLLPLAGALVIMSGAVKIFATMKWDELAKGLVGIGGGLTAVGFGLKLIGPSVLLIGPGLVAVAFGIGLLSGSVLAFGSMNLTTLAKGIVGIAGALVAIGFAIQAIPKTIILQAAGLTVLSLGLAGIAASVKILGSMSLGSLVKGIIGLGGALGVLSIGLDAMAGGLPGAAALALTALALTGLVPSLIVMGKLKWTTIAKGLGAIALSLGVLAGIGVVAGPGLLAVGIGLGAVGLAAVAVAGSVYILAKAFALLSGNGAKGLAVFLASLTALVLAIPKLIIDFIKGLVQITAEIAKIAPEVVKSTVVIVNSLLDGLIKALPKIGEAALSLISELAKVLGQGAPKLANTALDLLVAFLKAIADHIGKVTRQAADIVIHFLEAIADKLPDIIKSGAHALSAFLSGIVNNIADVLEKAARVVAKFLQGIADHLPEVIKAGAHALEQFLKGIADNIGDVIDKGANVIVKFLDGIARNISDVVDRGAKVVAKFIEGLGRAAGDLVDGAAAMILRFLQALDAAVKKYTPQIVQTGIDIGADLAAGIVKGVLDGIADLPGKISGLFGGSGSDNFDKLLHPKSRSAVISVAPVTPEIAPVVASLTEQAANQVGDIQPTITPVLDLSNVEAGARQLSRLGDNVIPISTATSFSQAQVIMAAVRSAMQAQAVAAESAAKPSVELNQYNTSPEALSEIEIYRQTRNLFSQAVNALAS